LSAKPEVANKVLVTEKAAQQVTDQALWASQGTSTALTRDLQSAQASAHILKEELSAKSVTLVELVIREQEAHVRLQILDDEKKAQDQLLESTQKMLSKRNFFSSTMISLAVAHAVTMLKSHT
jgi:hypothetical protein